jgi:type VI secretion system protein ImpL
VTLYLFSIPFLVVSLILCWLIGPVFHLHGSTLIVMRSLILMVGVAAASAVVAVTRRRKSSPQSGNDQRNTSELGDLIRDAQHRLASSQRASAKTFDAAPLFYILGAPNSAKTTTVLRAGLDPELLAGQIYRDQSVVPTDLSNFWYTQQGVLVESGESLRDSYQLWESLVRKTRPKIYQSALGATPPARAAVVCTSIESCFGSGAAESLAALARSTNQMLRTISRQLGTDLPVYVVFTKLDRVPGFSEFVRHLSTEEVSAPLGIALPRNSVPGGLYAEHATASVTSSLDRLFFSIGEFRLEVLTRESDQPATAPIYEFPREMQKLRNNLASYLVELTRPSQLSANPYLRGFYFTGVRAHISEQAVSTPAAVHRHTQAEADATRILSLRNMQGESQQSSPQLVSQKVAQWCFLPRLFSEAIFADRDALSGTRSSERVHLLRRIGFATLSAMLLFWLTCLTVSYRNNSRLERTIRENSSALPSGPPRFTLASSSDLASLDHLRVTLLQLEDYEQNGAPLMFRWGLYRGDSLIKPARLIYFDRFQRVLLARTQRNLVTTLRALPATVPADADYYAAYNPLRAYLITTSYPDKSTEGFLAPILVRFWLNGEQPESGQQSQLAEQQFSFYAAELVRANPYHISPAMPAVIHARAYLNGFGDFDRIYQNMLAAANRVAPSIEFNRLFPGSAATVVDSHIVPGAFTRNGFVYMQNATQHPDHYFTGEDWVLGAQATPSLQAGSLSQKLAERYAADFSTQWQTFLRSAAVVRYRSLQDAKEKLQSLSSPNSALLALMFTASRNTAVASPPIAHEFQPTQALVPSDSTNRLIAPGNTNYINGLIGLEGALSQFTQDPAAANNPAATQPVISAAVNAHGSVDQTAQSFNIDSQVHIERTVISLLQAPITSVEEAVRGQRPEQLNVAGRGFCSSFSSLATKYPFSRNATVEATPAEVSSMLKPASGTLWQFYDSDLKPYIAQQGDTWVAAPNAPVKPTAAFLQFFNRAAALSKAFFPAGAASGSLTFNVHILRSKEIQSVTLAIDTQSLTGADVSKDFSWSLDTAGSAGLLANYGSGSLPLQFNGRWALFHLVDRGKLEALGNADRLDYPLEVANTPVVVNGTPLTERMEISGPGASILLPSSLNNLHCVPQIAH